MMKWKINGDKKEPWRMAFETLLRCGGNMTIPGTDKNSRLNRQMAADMDYGLLITMQNLWVRRFLQEHIRALRRILWKSRSFFINFGKTR